MTQRSDLPFGSEFSPSQISLTDLLEIAVANEGDVAKLQQAIQSRFFAGHGGGNEKNQRTLAMNCRLGMKAYGLIDDQARLTEFGQDMFALKDNESQLYKTLGRHILLNLKGMALIQCIRDMTAAGETVNLTSLREGLAIRGIHYPSGGKHPSMMRLWLAKAGVFVGDRWQIDEIRLSNVLWTDLNDYGVLSRFTSEQRAFLMALANTGIRTPQPANEITKLASATYGVKFPEKSLPKLVLNSLVDAGYITTIKTTEGRGAKPFLVTPTEKLEVDLIAPLLDQLKDKTDPKLLALLRKSLAEILSEIDSNDRFVAGLALEDLAFKLMRFLDMNYVATRLRAQTTGGAEVDLIFESARLVFSRWQIQCKNTAHVSLDDVAKEVGLTPYYKTNVIVVVSTGAVSSEAYRYSRIAESVSPITVVFVDGAALEKLCSRPTHLIDLIEEKCSALLVLQPNNLSSNDTHVRVY